MNYYQRTTYSNKRLENLYNFDDKFQILPSDKERNRPSFNKITLEYDYDFFLNYHYRTYDRNHDLVNFVYNEIFSNEILSLITLISNGFFLIRNIDAPRNNYPEVSQKIKELSIEIPDLIGENFGDQPLEILDESNKFFRNLYRLSKEDLITVKSAIHWHYSASVIGWEMRDYNSQYIAFINSIEALCKIEFDEDPEKCLSCGQPKYKVTKKFIDLLIKYSGDPRSNKEKKDLYRRIYNKRSDLVHKGELFVPGIEGFINTSGLEDIKLLSELKKASQNAIFNFVLNNN